MSFFHFVKTYFKIKKNTNKFSNFVIIDKICYNEFLRFVITNFIRYNGLAICLNDFNSF